MTQVEGGRYLGISLVWGGESGREGESELLCCLQKVHQMNRSCLQQCQNFSGTWDRFTGMTVLGETRSLWRGSTTVRHRRRCEGAGHAGEVRVLMEQSNPSLQPKEPQRMPQLRRWRKRQIIWAFGSYLLWSDTYFANDLERKCLSKWKEKITRKGCFCLFFYSSVSFSFFPRYIQSERFFWRSQLFVGRAEHWFGVFIFRWCYQFLCYQVLHVGYERPGEVWFIMFPFGAFTTVIFYNLLLNLVLHDGRRLLGDKCGKHSLLK